MATEIVELKVSEEISASTDVCDTYTPASGKNVYLLEFFGDAAFSENSVVMITWDYGGGSEEIVWSTKGSARDNGLKELIGTGDGVKKVAVCCSNGETGALVMFCKALLGVE